MFKRVCSFILTLVILISCNLNVFEINGEEQQVTLVQIPIFSNEIDEKYLTGYLFNNSEYFVSIDDICRLTRSTYEISDNKITIKRGIEYVTLYVQDNTITLEGKNVECKIRKYNETYLLKPYSMLKLFGAYCDYFEEDNVFAIIMPEFTISETIDFNLYNSIHYNIAKEKISKYLTLAGSSMFMDLLSRGTGMISFAFTKGTNEYIDNSLYEISKVNIYDYPNVKKSSSNILNERIYIAESLLKITDDTNKIFKDILECDSTLNKLSENAENLNNVAEIISTVKSAEEKINYDLGSYLLLKRTLTHDNLDNLNMEFCITDRAEYVSKVMESKLSAYFNTSIDKVQEKLLDEGIEKIFENIDKIYGADVCSFLMAYDIGTSVTKLLMNNTFEAYKSNLNAIYLSVIQDEIFKVAQKIYEINRQEHFTNHDNIQRLIDIYSLYDRVTIAMYENLKKADDEFKMFDKEFSNSFADFCDNSADNAYKLSLCKPEDASCSLKQFSDYYENDIFAQNYIDKLNDIIAEGICGDNLTWVLDNKGQLTIKGTGEMYDYTDMGVSWREYRKDIKDVVISDDVTYIGENAFAYCENLENINLPNGLTIISNSCFKGCKSLKSISIPESVTKLGLSAFKDCEQLTNIKLPDNLKEIGFYALQGCVNLTDIVIPESVEMLGNGSFMKCSKLKSIIIPNSIKNISSDTFAYCTSLTSLTIAKDVAIDGKNVFYKTPNVVIYGYSGTPAEKYANNNNIPFVELNNNNGQETTEDLIIETVTLTNGDIKPEWEHVTSLNLEYPVFKSKDTELQDFLTTSITEKILSYMETNSDYNVSIYGSFKYDMSVNGYLSISTSIANHAEGGNGTHTIPYTFFVDLQNKKILSLNDLFIETEDEIYKEVAIKANKYNTSHAQHDTLLNYNYKECKFTITKDNLILTFNPYSISSGAEGIINIEIPLTDLNLTCTIL